VGNAAVSKNPAINALRDVCESVLFFSFVASSVCNKSGSAAVQEVDDQVCRRLGLLFRDPVAAIRDDHVFDVIGNTPDHSADQRAERSFATKSQDRHLKLALRTERPVVGRIVPKREELRPLSLRRVARRAPHNARRFASSNRFWCRESSF
jgi:hypothetical protein